ncbi:thermonuclease family protein [Solibacillus sp. CAU 1738]|uniref:thermonuclease family protein n=1 Tax=Solibacillus sp. CAU 1738 TaxID=3140363 RepID=UPI0032608A83
MKLQDIKTLITSGTILLGLALYFIFADPPPKKVEDTPYQIEQGTATEQTTSEVKIPAEYAKQATGNELQQVKFLAANDGDTFSVELDGKKQKVRLLMVDTTEMNYNKGEPMPYAAEAKAFTEDLLKNASTIELLFDVGPKTDKYDRLLAYVYVDGVLLQEALLENGLAVMRYMNKPNNTLEQELRDVQAQAEASKLNIWAHEGYFENNQFHVEAVQ